MQGIDISNWQNGIDISAVPSDFVIMKATQGTSYVSPDFDRQINQASSCGKLLGVYHYIGGQGAAAEMQHFVNKISSWIGKAIPVLDWESEQNSAWQNENYLKQCIQEFKKLTGIPPIVYASLSAFPWNLCSAENCGSWVAQYANMNATGYQDNPWNEGAYSCVIRQYSSCGRLSGYGGNLDINKAYINAEQWMKYANPDGSDIVVPTPVQPSGNGNTIDLVAEVLSNKINGDERKAFLGDRYNEVQDVINHIFTADVNTLVKETWDGMYGNGDLRRKVLDSRYDEVMASINGSSKKSIDQLANEVIAGQWGNNPERARKLTAAGYDAQAVQERVNQMLS